MTVRKLAKRPARSWRRPAIEFRWLSMVSQLSMRLKISMRHVLLDFKLPAIGGYELLGRLKTIKRLQHAKFFAVSGYAREDIQEEKFTGRFRRFHYQACEYIRLKEIARRRALTSMHVVCRHTRRVNRFTPKAALLCSKSVTRRSRATLCSNNE